MPLRSAFDVKMEASPFLARFFSTPPVVSTENFGMEMSMDSSCSWNRISGMVLGDSSAIIALRPSRVSGSRTKNEYRSFYKENFGFD